MNLNSSDVMIDSELAIIRLYFFLVLLLVFVLKSSYDRSFHIHRKKKTKSLNNLL